MRSLLLFSWLATIAAAAAIAIAGCGDDPGFGDEPEPYSIDATPDGILQAYLEAGEPGP